MCASVHRYLNTFKYIYNWNMYIFIRAVLGYKQYKRLTGVFQEHFIFLIFLRSLIYVCCKKFDACNKSERSSIDKKYCVWWWVWGSWSGPDLYRYFRNVLWYIKIPVDLVPPCLTLSIVRYSSRVKWSNPGNELAPSLHLGVVSIETRAFGLPWTTVANFTYS